MITFSSFSFSKGNELIGDDYYLVKKFNNFILGIVCDGVGSAQEGANAAKRVVDFLDTSFDNLPKSWSIEKSMKHFITSINSILYNESMQNYESVEMLTTLAIVIVKDNKLHLANVGDSRIYLLRNNTLHQLSFDHNVDGMSNVLSEAIGMREDVGIYYAENKLQAKDKILLCSDGLYDILDENEIKKYISLNASLLVRNASKKVNDNLPDDTTAVIININELDKKTYLKQKNIPIIQPYKNMKIDGFLLKKSLIQNNLTWLATKKGKNYVLKFPPLEAKDDEIFLDLYVKEAINSIKLKAGFFPKAVIPKKRSARYYIMQYLEGETLKKKKLSIDETVKLTKMLLRAEQYLVNFDLVHGDIKPENIIKTKTFKLIDFGSITEIFSHTSKAGTPSYLAPERFENSPINESTEIFSIGVTLYELLTNKLPYGEIEPFQTPKFKEPIEPKKINKNIPEWLNSVILRAIEIDKEKRYKHYSEMLFEISNPEKVEPYIKIDKFRPLKVYLFLSIFLNIIMLIILFKQ